MVDASEGHRTDFALEVCRKWGGGLRRRVAVAVSGGYRRLQFKYGLKIGREKRRAVRERERQQDGLLLAA